MDFAAPRPWVKISKDLRKPGRRPVTAVVAFVGHDAPKVMPLRGDDTLVCDASHASVRAGTTSAAALQAYQRKGVEVFSVEDLHAKVILGSRWAWVGSANASVSSQDLLLEAAVRVTETQALHKIRDWVDAQCTDFAALSKVDLAELAAIPVRRRPRPPKARLQAAELPDAAKVRWLIGTGSAATQVAMRAAAKERAVVQRSQRRRQQSSSLEWFEWIGEVPVKRGDWIVEVASGHPRRPAEVVRVSRPDARRHIVWLNRVKTSRRPRLGELLNAAGCSRAEWDKAELIRLKVKLRNSVVALYR